MKRLIILALLVALCLAFTLAACGKIYVPSIGMGVVALPDIAEEQIDILNTTGVLPISTGNTMDAVDTNDEYQGVDRVELGCCMTNIAVRDTAVIGANSAIHSNNDFIMTLNSDKHVYSTTDIIKLWGTLEYVGGDDTITIYSSCPFMLFSITGGYDFDFGRVMGTITADLLVESVLESGRVYHFDYQKTGGWSLDDPDAKYWELFFSEEDLLLPVGEYSIILIGGFSLSERIIGSESGLRVELTIVVTE